MTEASTGNTCDGIYGVYINVCANYDWIVGSKRLAKVVTFSYWRATRT